MPSKTVSKGTNPRPPVVAVLGHVDHGKTTLLDYIRKTNVAAREAGGITQSVGAYEIEHSGKKITFIDTPGHEAFTKMRSRGCSIADLAILVVAADDGVKPQTAESIKILTESETPFVVAINKMDATGADLEKTKNDLTAHNVLLEGYGGSVSFQPISAKTGEGVNELLDLLLLAAELEELTYDPAAPASGIVLESKMDRRRGLEAVLIVKDGTLRRGDDLTAGGVRGKAKILENFLGETAESLAPSSPALVIGFENLPAAGEFFVAGAGDALAVSPGAALAQKQSASLAAQDAETENTVRVVLKATNSGSLEALAEVVRALPLDAPIRIIDASVGDVVDNDVKLAVSSGAHILSFASRVDKAAKNLADAQGVRIIESKIIYELTKTLEEIAQTKAVPKAAGILEVLAVFSQLKLDKQVIGGKVIHGTFRTRAPFRIVRGTASPGQGRVLNLQHNKKDAAHVAEGKEAGLMVNAAVAVEKGDQLFID